MEVGTKLKLAAKAGVMIESLQAKNRDKSWGDGEEPLDKSWDDGKEP